MREREKVVAWTDLVVVVKEVGKVSRAMPTCFRRKHGWMVVVQPELANPRRWETGAGAEGNQFS